MVRKYIKKNDRRKLELAYLEARLKEIEYEEKREEDENLEIYSDTLKRAKDQRDILRAKCKDYYNRTKLTGKKPNEIIKNNFKYEIGKFVVEL